jgi:phosphatidylglycerol:prolipoprotein diacylglycerol transferase
MFPRLFELPFIHLTIWTYGPMLVAGFLTAVFLLRKLALKAGQNPDHITNVALYALIAGVVGARIFYVVHHFSQFRGDPWWSVFAVWKGGLEFIGGLSLAVIVVVVYLLRYKLSVRLYLDMLAIGLMVGVCFGRMGCFLRGCCYGRPTEVPWAVRFPYDSPPYDSQVRPNMLRNRPQPQMNLPADFFGFRGEDGKTWFPIDEDHKYRGYLKPFKELTDQERYDVTKGEYRCLPVHPTQLYSSLNAVFLCGLLFFYWQRFGLTWPGCTFSLMFILYGFSRFWLGFLRDDNPFESGWWTISNKLTVSQNLGIYIAGLGMILMIIFARTRPTAAAPGRNRAGY